MADVHIEADDPLELYVEVRDTATRDYWTRVNYTTVVPPGQSTLVIPVKQLYVGEKSRPGRMLMLGSITGWSSASAMSRSRRSSSTTSGSSATPPAERRVRRPLRLRFRHRHKPGDGRLSRRSRRARSTAEGRGYGLKDARIWRAFDALQPDPLYQDFICIECGGLAVDVPNGRTASSSTSTAPPGSGASTRCTASGRSWPKASRW